MIDHHDAEVQVVHRVAEALAAAADAVGDPTPPGLATASMRPDRARWSRSDRARARLYLLPLAAVAAMTGLVVSTDVGRDRGLRSGVPSRRASAPPRPTGPRTELADAPELAAEPSAASAALRLGREGHWTWFVAGTADGRWRAAVDTIDPVPAALSADGRQLAVAYPGVLRIVDLTTGVARDLDFSIIERADRLPFGRPEKVSWRPGGEYVAMGGSEAVRVIIVGTREGPGPSLAGSGAGAAPNRVRRLSWTPDGAKYVASGDRGDLVVSSVRPPDPPTPRPGGTLRYLGSASSATLTSDGPVVGLWGGAVVVSGDGSVRVDDRFGRAVQTFATPGSVVPADVPPLTAAGDVLLVPDVASAAGAPEPVTYASVLSLSTGGIVGTLRTRVPVPLVLGMSAEKRLAGAIVVLAPTPEGSVIEARSWTSDAVTRLASLPRFGVTPTADDIALPGG